MMINEINMRKLSSVVSKRMEILPSPLNHARTNAKSTLSKMGCGTFSIQLILGIQIITGIQSLIRPYFLWDTPRSIFRTPKKDKKREDQYTIQNMNWSGTYLEITLYSAVLTKALPITTLKYYGTEVFF